MQSVDYPGLIVTVVLCSDMKTFSDQHVMMLCVDSPVSIVTLVLCSDINTSSGQHMTTLAVDSLG